MTKHEILEYFKDINHAYNESTRYDELKRMLDELTEPCEDCISRKEVIQIINDFSYKNEHEETLINERIKNLPSIQPKPKMGHWKKLNVGYGCSECSLATNKRGVDFYRFCPNCGAKMESEG